MYGESGDSPAVRALHELGITGLGIRRSSRGGKSKSISIARRRKGLPSYWKHVLSAQKPKKRANPTRRKNAYFFNKEKHSQHALVKWKPPHWPGITLYSYIKKYGVKGGQEEYARYLREHGTVLSRRRGGVRRGSPQSLERSSGMARRRKNPRGRRRRSALALLTPRRRRSRKAAKRSNPIRRRRRRKVARRTNPPVRRRRRKATRRARRRNSPIMWTPNPRKRRRKTRRKGRARRRNSPILTQSNPKRRRRKTRRGRARRRNSPILWTPNKGRKGRKGRRARRGHARFARRRNPDILGRLKEAIPTLEDLVNALTITGFGLAQELFAPKLFTMVGIQSVMETVPYVDHAAFTLLGTVGAALVGGHKWAQLVMYGGLSTILRRLIVEKVLLPELAGTYLKTAAVEAGYKPMSDYVTYGDRRPIAGGRLAPINDYVTMGCDTEEESVAAIQGGCDTFDVEPGQSDLADYYGVTAF